MNNSSVKAVAAGTTTTTTADVPAGGFRSALVTIKGSAGGGSVDVIVSGSSASGVAMGTILDSGSVSGTTAKVLRVSPDLAASANAIAQDLLPPNLHIVATVTGSYTYSVDVELCG